MVISIFILVSVDLGLLLTIHHAPFHDGNNGSCTLLYATIKHSIMAKYYATLFYCFIKLDYLPEQIIDLIGF